MAFGRDRFLGYWYAIESFQSIRKGLFWLNPLPTSNTVKLL